MPTITENWSSTGEWVRGESAQRVFIGTEFDSADDFLTALAAPPWSVGVNAPYSLDSRLRATQPAIERINATDKFRASVRYIRPEQGSITERPDDPLDEPPKIFWGKGTESVVTDVDAQGNPLVNAAYLPFDSQFTTNLNYRILRITVNQSSYSVSQAIAYEDHVNTDTITIPLAGSVAPGQMLCVSIEPTVEIDENAAFVPVAYTFHIRKGLKQDADGLWDAWKYRILNAGRTGWWLDGSTKRPAPFCSPAATGAPNGIVVDAPVQLGVDGRPFPVYNLQVAKDSNGNTSAAVAAPNTVNSNLLELDTRSNVYFLKYYKYPSRELGSLPVF